MTSIISFGTPTRTPDHEASSHRLALPFGAGSGKLAGLAIALLIVGALPPAALAHDGTPPEIVFPVIGDVEYTDTWGAPRSGGRTHEGTDIMGEKGLPVVAAADGVISWIDDECCHLAIDHGEGWSTWYIHLNNDTPGTDDGAGWGIADGLVKGSPVTAGQLIGWVGDSGNAEWVAPGLHFEIRQNGTAINPYTALVAAAVPPEPADAEVALGQNHFTDDEGSVHESNINRLRDLGITRGCNSAGTEYCPEVEVKRGQLAAFMRRFLELEPSEVDYFTDDDGSVFEEDINALVSAGIGFECRENEFCGDAPVHRDEMAEFLVRTFSPRDPERFANPDALDFFVDDTDNPFQASINRLRLADVTVGCSEGELARYCPDDHLTRAQMATFIIRAIEP